MPGQIPLRAIASFHAAARTGSVGRAAQALNVTPSAVSQQIRHLEEHLGTVLFARKGRANVLTEAGERYFEMVAGALEQVEFATERVRGLSAPTLLTIRSAPTFASQWLMPRIDDFLAENPHLELRLDATNEFTDFEREGVDVDIRYGEGRWPGLYSEPLARDRIRPLCSPGLAAEGSLEPGDLPDFRLIHSVKALTSWQAFFAAAGIVPQRGWRRILFDRSYMVIRAATGGLGIALESDVFAHAEIASGALVCPVRDPPDLRVQANWLVCPEAHLRSAKVMRFRDWLFATFETAP